MLGGSSTEIGLAVSAIGSTGSTDSLTILIFGLALDFDFGFALGLIFDYVISSSISSLIYYLISSLIGSFASSSLLLIISSICSRVSSSDIFDYLYIIWQKEFQN